MIIETTDETGFQEEEKKERDTFDIYNIGSRELEDNKLRKIVEILKPIFNLEVSHVQKGRIDRKIAGMLKNEDINYESALHLFGVQGMDIEILKIVYEGDEPINNINIPFYDIVKYAIPVEESQHIENQFKAIIKKTVEERRNEMIISAMGSTTNSLIDPKRKQIFREQINYDRRGEEHRIELKVVDAYPSKVTVYESPLQDEPRKWKVIWQSNLRKTPFSKGPCLLDELISDLKENGYVTANKYLNDVLTSALNSCVEQGLAEVKTEIETPGFFYEPSQQGIIAIKYDVSEPEKSELEDALKVLEELVKWYPNHESKVATIFKWGMIAPFIFAMKQLGTWVPIPYLYGKAKSGKTTLAHMVLYMWSEPNNDNDMSGGSFDTVARVGNRLSQSTFPIVVNEPAGAFNRVSVVEILKSAIERTSSRGKYEGRSYRTIPSYAPPIFTANMYIPDDDALMRRFLLLNFTHSEKKEDDAIKDFEEEFQIKNPKRCKLNAFKAITQSVAMEILGNLDLLTMDWRELANTLIMRIYMDAGMDIPPWMLKWSKSETMEDMDEEHREDIRIFMLDQINRAYGRVQVMDDEYRPKAESMDSSPDVKGVDYFKAKVWTVVNERLIPWMVPYNVHDTDYVCLTIGFKKELHKELKICQPLKGISELMGWDYQTVRLPSPQMVIKISFKKFMAFLYPTGQD